MHIYKYASAFPGAMFTIPCNRESKSQMTPAQSTSTTSSANVERPPRPMIPAQSARSRSICSWHADTVDDDAAYDSDSAPDSAPGSPTLNVPTWGRRPEISYLGPLIEIVSPWGVQDAKDVFGETLRFGDRLRPGISIEEEIRPDTPSPSPSQRHDSSMQQVAAPSICSRSAGSGLVSTAPVLRPDMLRSERVRNLMRTSGLRVQTQNLNSYYPCSRLFVPGGGFTQ